MDVVTLDGTRLDIKGLYRISHEERQIRIKPSVWRFVERSRAFVEQQVSGSKTIYGFNTGFGALAQVRIDGHDLAALQHNILLSHSAGVGKPFPKEHVRAALALRINTLIKGYSGVSRKLIERLVTLLNRDIIPIVPTKGSVGASGDLAPMATIGMTVIGKGKVWYRGKETPAINALRREGLKPLKLEAKEGLSLINGTQFSTALAALVNHEGSRLNDCADVCGAMSLDVLKGSKAPFHPFVTKLRPHAGARISANRLRRFLTGSSIMRSHINCKKVQDPYSLRCMAQIHGAVRDIFSFAENTIIIEMNSVTDNPIVLPGPHLILSNGNFHGEPVGFALDFMAIGLAELCSVSERRIARMLDSKISGLSPFLAKMPGLNSGFMMAQVTAAALVSQNKILCHPATVDSIPTSANQEDHVSMSMNAGLKALEVLENTKYVLAIELLCACQALDLLKPLRSSPPLEKRRKTVRRHIPFVEQDHSLTDEIEKLKILIESGRLH